MKKYTLFLLFLCLSLLMGCYEKIENTRPRIRGLSAFQNQSLTRNIDACCLTYSFANYTSRLPILTQEVLLEQGIIGWAFNMGNFAFSKGKTGEKTDLTIQFVSPEMVEFKVDTVRRGWIASPVESLGLVHRKDDGTYILYLNQAHDWTENRLGAILFHQLGVVLGLPVSDDPRSIMYPYMVDLAVPLIDIKSGYKIDSLYNSTHCDSWQEIGKIPFQPSSNHSYQTFSTYEKAFVIVNGSEMWAFDPFATPQWSSKTPPNFKGLSFTIFGVNNKAYAITTPNTNQHEWWEYDLTSDTWNRLNTPLPFFSSQPLISHSVNDKGYVLYTDQGRINIWEFSPTTKNWVSKKSYPVLPNTSLQQNLLATHTQKLLLVLPLDNEVIRYDPTTNNWIQDPPFPGFKNKDIPSILLSTKFRTYAYTPSHQMWEYALQWTALTSPSSPPNSVLFGLSLKCRGYLITNDGRQWYYQP